MRTALGAVLAALAIAGPAASCGAGTNDFGRTAWGGPCPPVGRHRYVFELHALDVVLPDLGTGTRAAVQAAMSGHVVATARRTGTFAKGGR